MIGTGTGLAIAGGVGALGNIAGGLIGQGGASAAANASLAAANQAYLANQHQMEVNRSDASPWTSAGRQSLNSIGALMGWGTLTNPGTNGSTWEWSGGDPNQQAAAQAQARNWINAMYGAAPTVATPDFQMMNVPSTFEEDPGYQFRLKEGQAALDRSAAAKGMLLSGAQVKASTDYNQGMASQEYGNWWNRYRDAVAMNNANRQQDYSNRWGQDWAKYQNNQGQVGNYLGMLTGLAGSGQAAQASLSGQNSGLTGQGGNYLTGAGNAAGQAYQGGANAMASALGAAGNNLLVGGYLATRGGGVPGGGGASGYTGKVPYSGGDYPGVY